PQFDFHTFLSNYVNSYSPHYFLLLMCVVPMSFILFRHPSIGKKNLTKYHFVLATLVVMSLLDSVDHQLDLFKGQYVFDVNIRKVICIFCYMIKPTVAMCVVYTIVPKDSKIRHFIWIPLAVNFIAYSFNFFPATSFFTITENNEWIQTGPIDGLVYFGFVSAGIYVLLLIAFSIYSFRSRNFCEGFSVLFSTAMVIIGYIVEAAKSIFNLGNNAMAVACLFYMLFLIIKFASFDPLTDLHNRQAFYVDIRDEKRINAIISIDTNGLKEINDKYGHIRGDEALKTISDKISHCVRKGSIAYRVGGDEFVVTCQGFSEEKVKAICECIRDNINNKTEFSVSIGYAMRGEEDSIRQMIVRADNMMYHNKAVIKEELEKNKTEEHSGMIPPKPIERTNIRKKKK
ncbi:MAG: GGDEF domain-containing protein, partial [Gammaproteobacteria bacterium]|nr:GGDEF domain-containing protein [Gammaproteobacteria bacterium]